VEERLRDLRLPRPMEPAGDVFRALEKRWRNSSYTFYAGGRKWKVEDVFYGVLHT